MRRAAILNPGSLVGGELKQALERAPEGWDRVRLLSSLPGSAGTLTEVAGEAALLEDFDPETLSLADALFVCGEPWPESAELRELAGDTLVLLVGHDDPPEDAVPVVAGLDLEGARRGRVLVSPHPAAVLLARLLDPLRALGLESATATVLEPASERGQGGLEELLAQARGVLAFQGEIPRQVFGAQLAFNLLPSATPAAPVERHLAHLLGPGAPVSVQLVRASVFHSVAAAVHAVFRDGTEVEAVHRALSGPGFLPGAELEAPVSPAEAANRGEILLGEIRADPARPGSVWLWAALDNLTSGGALNALAVADALLAAAEATS